MGCNSAWRNVCVWLQWNSLCSDNLGDVGCGVQALGRYTYGTSSCTLDLQEPTLCTAPTGCELPSGACSGSPPATIVSWGSDCSIFVFGQLTHTRSAIPQTHTGTSTSSSPDSSSGSRTDSSSRYGSGSVALALAGSSSGFALALAPALIPTVMPPPLFPPRGRYFLASFASSLASSHREPGRRQVPPKRRTKSKIQNRSTPQ